MEESTKRRERLKAMREEASQAATYNNAEDSNIYHSLSNPLIETSGSDPVEADSRASHKFDFYTDPMSAFSGNKRSSSKVSPQTPKDHFTPPSLPATGISPSPQLQPQMNNPSNQQTYQPQGPTYFPSDSPRGVNLSNPNFNSGQGRAPWFNNNPGPSGGPGFRHAGSSPNFYPGQVRGQWFSNSPNPGGNPIYNPGQGRGHWFNNHPSPGGTGSGPGFGQGSSPSFNPGHPSPGGTGGIPGFGEGSSPGFGQGRGHWFNNHPSPGSGGGPRFVPGSSPNINPQQGRGNRINSPGYAGPSSGGPRWFNPGPGRGGGRGRGGHNNASAEQRPDLYYNKSMIEDPWELLEPIVWRRENIPSLNNPRKSWIPESIRVKKVRVVETSTDTGSKQSLAEYLAASFNEASKEEQSGE